MRNLKLVLAFDGTAYSGWQRQTTGATVQETVEQAVAKMTLESVQLHGAGRTDAGVHALAMVANFATDSTIPPAGFLKGLNSILPNDIRVMAVEEMPADFHARISAKGKRYTYRFVVTSIMEPCQRLYATHIYPLLDIERMRSCLPLLLGEHDFSSFEASGSRDKNFSEGRGAKRIISEAELHLVGETRGMYEFTLSGDGFLRHMVRNIMGTLFEIGKGRLTVDEFQEILDARDRTKAGATAPPQGLFLKEVFY